MGEDTVEVIRKILTDVMVEVIQKILTEDMADIKRIRTGDMAEIKLVRTEDEVLAKTISVWYIRISSRAFSERSLISPPCTTAAIASLRLTSDTGIPFLVAMSSTVSVPSEMIPTERAIALAVMGWSPVTMITLIPADLHFKTASGTAALGGSIMDMRPTKRRPSSGKFSSSAL